MDVQFFSNGTLLPQKKLEEFVQLPITPQFLCVLKDSISKGKIGVNGCLKYYCTRLEDELSLYAFCLCLREGGNPNIYIDSKTHILSYLLEKENNYSRIAALCCLEMGTDLSLQVVKGSLETESVSSWMSKRKIVLEPKEEDRKILTILTGRRGKYNGMLTEYDVGIVISCQSSSRELSDIYPSLSSKLSLDYTLLLRAVEDYDSYTFDWYVSGGYPVSYGLLCTIVSLIDQKNPVLSNELRKMLVSCAKYGVEIDSFLIVEIEDRYPSISSEVKRQYSIPYIEKLRRLSKNSTITNRMLRFAEELHLDSSSFLVLLDEIEYCLSMDIEDFLDKQYIIITEKYCLPERELDVDSSVHYDYLKDYRIFYREGDMLKMILSSDFASNRKNKEAKWKLERIHRRYEDPYKPLTYEYLFSSFLNDEEINDITTDKRMRELTERHGELPKNIPSELLVPYLSPSEEMNIHLLSYIVSEDEEKRDVILSQL